MIYTRWRQALAGLALFMLACSLQAQPLAIRVGEVAAWVEVAATPAAREQGLMGRTALARDHGMLFVFPRVEQQHFWMRNTLIPLDVGFFDRHGVLINVITMLPDEGKRIHSSTQPARYALEMNPGWFLRNGLSVGSRLQLSFPLFAQ